jgi:hypothetical protein
LFGQLISKEYGFYDLFERHAQTTLEAAFAMHQAVLNLSNNREIIARITELEHKCDEITHMTVDLMHRTFITPLDRDEILKLISRMDDVVDFIDAAAHRLELFEITEVPPRIVQLCQVLIDSQKEIGEMVKLLRKIRGNDLLKHGMEINRLENQADQLHRDGLGELFHRYKHDPLLVIKLKEIYEILETSIDSCEDVANIVEGIVLEHS